ncbi:hypothetical protein H0H81_000150 [Sphagnurus paluster]|uniref:Polysaccharide lyase 14 domain-containing protein n=1 Tax=Sphagnurus paluster TaxID=117069 RepID=A0A9P7GID1_9AGAR|nr:hypothetical protein H0H81_000150 [Sphagnurus paluster]
MALILSSLTLSGLATPISKQKFRSPGGRWPNTINIDAKSSFGISGNLNPNFLQTINGVPTLVGNYPKGSYAGSKGPGAPGISGFIFSASGSPDVQIERAKEAKLTYEVQFASGFDFALGGKMPGLLIPEDGGMDADTAGMCSGGRHSGIKSDACFSARLMWRDAGKGELYAYLPTANNDNSVCQNKCGTSWGRSIGTGKWVFKPGEWTQITERVRLNDVGQSNGEIEVLIGGDSKVKVGGLVLRSDERGRLRGVMMHTFFGGSSKPDYASPKDQKAYFRGFTLEVTETI